MIQSVRRQAYSSVGCRAVWGASSAAATNSRASAMAEPPPPFLGSAAAPLHASLTQYDGGTRVWNMVQGVCVCAMVCDRGRQGEREGVNGQSPRGKKGAIHILTSIEILPRQHLLQRCMHLAGEGVPLAP